MCVCVCAHASFTTTKFLKANQGILFSFTGKGFWEVTYCYLLLLSIIDLLFMRTALVGKDAEAVFVCAVEVNLTMTNAAT